VNDAPGNGVWTADELLAMTPNERHAIVKAGIVTELDQVPLDLLERARADILAHIAASDSSTPPDPR
jgi:hypothetical protein